jgi:hypothetical protein
VIFTRSVRSIVTEVVLAAASALDELKQSKAEPGNTGDAEDLEQIAPGAGILPGKHADELLIETGDFEPDLERPVLETGAHPQSNLLASF